MSNKFLRNTISIYRDCIRAAEHLGGQSAKADNIKKHIREEFKRNKDVTDPEQIELLREDAITGLSNYLLIHNLSQIKTKPSLQRAQFAAAQKQAEEEAELKAQAVQREKQALEAATAAIKAKMAANTKKNPQPPKEPESASA